MNIIDGYLLIAEDDPDILRLLDTTLKFKGHRVVTARNGREGLEAIQQELPLIIITDIMMPKLDGFGLVHRLRIDPKTRDIPVVFITATYVMPEDREFALNIGVTRFVQKPIDFERFLKTIDDLLQGGVTHSFEPLKEMNFYEGYRYRLETKLKQKIKQITRDEHLLTTRTDDENQALQISIRQAIYERDEIKLLLDQIHEHLEKTLQSELHGGINSK